MRSRDAARLGRWYREVLGIELESHPNGTDFYKVFATRDAETSELRENPVFAIQQADEPLAEGDRGFVVNLRVDDLDGLLARLRERGVAIEERQLRWERGAHAWIRDADGNRIELYQELRPKSEP